MFLTERIDDRFEYNGIVLNVNMAFDNILLFYAMLKDNDFTNSEKIIIGLEMLIVNYEDINELPLDVQYELFVYVLKEFLGEDITRKEESNTGKSDNNGKVSKKDFDFDVDGERIYASFLMDYRIDLIDMQGKLHWKKFIALFNGLSEETPFKKVVQIRTMEVPAPTKYNQKERQRIRELKRMYALEQTSMQEGLSKVASFLKG